MFCLRPYTMQVVSCDLPDVYYVMTKAELDQQKTLTPFVLDNESAVLLSGALLLIMAVAFVFRQIRKSLETEESNHS